MSSEKMNRKYLETLSFSDLVKLADEYDGRIVVGKCDVEEADDIAAEMGIRNIPTILFFKNGQLVDKFVGATTKANLQQKFDALL